jgi:hypothetical protein
MNPNHEHAATSTTRVTSSSAAGEGDRGSRFPVDKLQKSPEHFGRDVGKVTALKETEKSGLGEVAFIVILSTSLILVVGWLMG